MAATVKTQVVIIGGSLVGLGSAMFLAARGVKCILIERHTGSSPHPRALGYTHRTIETFRTVGLDKEIPALPPGVGGKPRRVKTKTLNGEWEPETAWTGGQAQQKPQQGPPGKPPGGGPGGGPGGAKPGPPDLSSITPVRDTAIAQDKLEPLIRAKAISFGADLRLGYKAHSWAQDPSGVTVTATDSSGTEINMRADYLIAADGAGSPVRNSLEIQTEGVGYLRTLRSILFRSPILDETYRPKGISQWTISNDSVDAFLVSYPDGRWALMSYNAAQDELDPQGQKQMIYNAVGEEVADIELITSGKWDLRASIAQQFSSGRIFLAGDAAHALPPNRGGYGANTGFGDAHNLAWKMASVLSGESKPELLDTYDVERRSVAMVRHDQIFARDDYKPYLEGTEWVKTHPVPAAVIDDVAMELGQIYRSGAVYDLQGGDESAVAKTPKEWAGRPGTRAPHVWVVRDGEEEVSTLEWFCKGWVVISEDEKWGDVVSGGLEKVQGGFVLIGGKDVKEKTPGAFREAFGTGEKGASLVRPDGFVAARWTEEVSQEEFAKVLGKVAYL